MEYLDIVNDSDEVIRAGERGAIHSANLPHRAVHIFLFNSAGELFVQKRAKCKKEHPGKYDSSAAGHVDAGEGYDSAAGRELYEELGIRAPLEKVAYIKACSDTDNEFVWFYIARSDDEITIDKNEIEQGYYWSLATVKNMVAERGAEFTPAFILLYHNYIDSL